MERNNTLSRALALGVALYVGAGLCSIDASAQVTVSADGPGNTYELLESRGFGLETPDCGHPVRHVREIFDSALGKNVFAFDSHRDLDDDRCTNFDRQRMEVKTAPGSANQGVLQHANGQTAYYRWKFKLPSGFQASSNFTHIFQIKAQAGSDAGAPLVTITPRAGSPDILQIIWTPPSGQSGGGVKAQADLSLFRNVWVEAFVQYLSADSGNVQLSIKRLSDGATLVSWNSGTVDTWRSGNNYNRGKWGIYRSLNSISQLRDETVLFADWCVSETSASQCPSAAGGGGGGAIRIEAEDMTKTDYETNNFEGEECARATSNAVGNVRATFTGSSGTRDITVRYHDENDGQATFTLRVGGAAIASWTANVDDHTWKTRTFAGVFVSNGAEIRIEAAREEGEHARIDYAEIGPASGGAVRFEAEDMTKTDYETNTFEGEECARATSNTIGNIRTTFTGSSGTRDIIVRYHDENDGQAVFALRVNGVTVGSWTANVDDHTWKTRTFTGVFVANGAEIRIEAAREEGEHARIDYVEIR